MVARTLLPSLLIFTLSAAALAAPPVPLIDKTGAKVPNDTTGPVELAWIDQAGGTKALRVAFTDAGSFGETRPKTKDWSKQREIIIEALNPSNTPVTLTLTIRHGGSKNFDTRIDVPVELASGRKTKTLAIADLKNNDGSAPDLTGVSHWYFTGPKGATIYLIDLSLNTP